MNHHVETIFWMAPVIGLTMAIVSISFESWRELPGSRFLDGPGHLQTTGLLTLPGFIAFSIVLTEY
jgi:solute carrier family 35 protein C2